MRRSRGIPCAGLGAATAMLLVLPGLSGCTRSVDSSTARSADAAPTRGGSLHLMFEAPGTLDPPWVDDVYEACIVNQIFDGLLELDANLNPVPAIAREWAISRDGLEYTIALRTDVTFHNGRRVVADDVLFSYTRVFDPSHDDFGLGGAYLQRIEGANEYHAGRAKSIAGLSAPDDSTVVIRLEEAYGPFLSVLAMDQTKIVPREEVEGRAEEFARHPVGTGPFRFERIEEGPDDPRIVLRANRRHFRKVPWIEEVQFHVPPDYNVDKTSRALLAGILSVGDVTGEWRDAILSDPRFTMVRRPELSFSFIGLDVDREPFDDVRVRRAIAQAINRERLLSVDPAGRMPAGGILPPGVSGYSPDPKALPYDPDEARRLLAEAGHPGGRGLPVLRHYQVDRGGVGRLADRLLREDLAAVGIDLELVYAEWDELSDDLDAHRLPSFGLTWVADLPDPDSFLTSLFQSHGVYNLCRYSSARVDSLLARGAIVRDSMDRARLYREAERIILSDAPVIPLFHTANNFAVRVEVKGLLVTPFGYGNLALENVWIDQPAG